jgi:hypothetical protein
MKYTLKDLKKGRCAVINDGTIEELDKVVQSVLKTRQILYESRYAYIANKTLVSVNHTSLPKQSVKDFLKEIETKTFKPKRGDKVIVWDIDEEHGEECIFLTKIKGALYPYVCVSKAIEKEFKEGKAFNACSYRYIEPLSKKIIPKDTLVYVKNYEEHTWEIRFYSHFEKGKHYCFNCQKKSTEIDEYGSWTIVTDINPFQ